VRLTVVFFLPAVLFFADFGENIHNDKAGLRQSAANQDRWPILVVTARYPARPSKVAINCEHQTLRKNKLPDARE